MNYKIYDVLNLKYLNLNMLKMSLLISYTHTQTNTHTLRIKQLGERFKTCGFCRLLRSSTSISEDNFC